MKTKKLTSMSIKVTTFSDGSLGYNYQYNPPSEFTNSKFACIPTRISWEEHK